MSGSGDLQMLFVFSECSPTAQIYYKVSTKSVKN